MGTGAEIIRSEQHLEVPRLSNDLEQVMIVGDLKNLNPQQRVEYYGALCKSLDLNPLTKPFEYLELDGRLVLYARKDCTEQLRSKRNISLTIISREVIDNVYVVTARATTAVGRTDESIGAVPLVKEGGEWKTATSGKRYFAGNGQFTALSPADKANTIMKAETKAKRRVTLSICGLGMLDETEIEPIPATVHDPRGTKEAAQDVAQRKVAAMKQGVSYKQISAEIAAEQPPMLEDHGELPIEKTEFDEHMEAAAAAEKQWHQDEPKKSKTGDFYKDMLTEFDGLKKLNREIYYRVLGVNGFAHANEIKDRDTAVRLRREILEAAQGAQPK